MWMVDPVLMCREHLLGEHREMHALVGMLTRKKSLTGYIKKGLLTPKLIGKRHDQLAKEIVKRGYNHLTPMIFEQELLDYLPEEQQNSKVDLQWSQTCLVLRCDRCKDRERIIKCNIESISLLE
jgi:hypothetical protein